MGAEVHVNPEALRRMAGKLDGLEAAFRAVKARAASCIDGGVSDDPAEWELAAAHGEFAEALLDELSGAADQLGKYARNMRANADSYVAADVLEAPR